MTTTEVLVGARLSSAQSLVVFRAVLSAASRPGTLIALADDAAPGVPRAAVPALALADLDVSVAALDHEAGWWASVVRTVTGCQMVTPADADMVVALREPAASEIAALRVGTANAPERAARLFVACRSVTPGRGDGVTIRLRGPGASTARTFCVDGLNRDVFAALAALNRAFPVGVDTWLVADDGAMSAIPRSAHIELVESAERGR